MKTEIKMHTLKNGLTVIGEACPARKSVAIGFFVKTGARDESLRESGLSHFIEHMVFKGSKSRDANRVKCDFGKIGSHENAFTSEENTVFYCSVLPEYGEEALDILADIMRPTLDEKEFNNERGVILEEIALYEDRPLHYLVEHAFIDYFGEHPAGKSILGTKESISDVTNEEMKEYFSRRYVPSNMALVVSGNFSWRSFLKKASKCCGDWKDAQVGRKIDDFAREPLVKDYFRKNLNQSHILFITRGASAQSEERFSLSVLAHILGDSSGSKLYWALVDKGLAESAGADNDERDGTGIFVAYASTSPENLEEVASVCREVMKKPLDFTSDDLERAKTKLISGLVLGGELSMGRLMSIGHDWAYRGTIDTLQQTISRIKGVTRQGIEAALDKYPLDSWSEFRLVQG